MDGKALNRSQVSSSPVQWQTHAHISQFVFISFLAICISYARCFFSYIYIYLCIHTYNLPSSIHIIYMMNIFILLLMPFFSFFRLRCHNNIADGICSFVLFACTQKIVWRQNTRKMEWKTYTPEIGGEKSKKKLSLKVNTSFCSFEKFNRSVLVLVGSRGSY